MSNDTLKLNIAKSSLKSKIAQILGAHGVSAEIAAENAARIEDLKSGPCNIVLMHDGSMDDAQFSSVLETLATSDIPAKAAEAVKQVRYCRAMNTAMPLADATNDTTEIATWVENLRQVQTASPSTIDAQTRYTESCRLVALIMDARQTNLLKYLDEEFHEMANKQHTQALNKHRANFELLRQDEVAKGFETKPEPTESTPTISQADQFKTSQNGANHSKELAQIIIAKDATIADLRAQNRELQALLDQAKTNNVEDSDSVQKLVSEIERLCKEGNLGSDVALRLGLTNRMSYKDLDEKAFRVSFGLDEVTSLSAHVLELGACVDSVKKAMRDENLTLAMTRRFQALQHQYNQVGIVAQLFVNQFCGAWGEGLEIDSPEYQAHAKLFAQEIHTKREELKGCNVAPQKAQSLDELVRILREDVDYLKRHAKKS